MPIKKAPVRTRAIAIPSERIKGKIYLVRGAKVMFDRDLADLYRVETKALNQAVKRNPDRFPEDFMFQLTPEETIALRSQFVTSNAGRGGARYRPYAFTEHGVAMLSSVLSSQRAVQMNILIIRAFVQLRQVLATHKDLALKLKDLERRQKKHSIQISSIIATLMTEPEKPKRRIGFPSR